MTMSYKPLTVAPIWHVAARSKNKHRLVDKEYCEWTIVPQVRALQATPNDRVKDLLIDAALLEWRHHGEGVYADWSEKKVYFHPKRDQL
jgi:hypothetical protein